MTILSPLDEAISQGICRTIERLGWDRVDHPLEPGAIRTCYPGMPLTLVCSPSVTRMNFLRHPWSGTIKLTVGETETLLPLSTESAQETVWFDLPPSDRDFQVTIESIEIKDRDPRHCEAWLLQLGLSGVANRVGKSILLNASTRLLYGDWGEFLVLSHDEVIPRAILEHGSWAPKDIELFQQNVKQGALVLDVGANFGHHSIVFSKIVGPEGKVIAIEAQRLMWQLVLANAALNRCDNIVALHAAAGVERGKVKMFATSYDSSSNFGALGVDISGKTEGEPVDVYPLDDLLPDHLDGRRIEFVKVDVQSFELFVLQGMQHILAEHRPRIFIEISPFWMQKAGYSYHEVYTLLKSHGYEFTHQPGLDLGADEYPDVSEDLDIEWDVLAVHPAEPG